MSKQIEIKGRKFSEETIVAALRAHTDWPEEEDKILICHQGDILSYEDGKADRLVVQLLDKIITVDKFGNHCQSLPAMRSTYIKLGRCTGFTFKED